LRLFYSANAPTQNRHLLLQVPGRTKTIMKSGHDVLSRGFISPPPRLKQMLERSDGIFGNFHKKRPNAPKGNVKPHTQQKIAAS